MKTGTGLNILPLFKLEEQPSSWVSSASNCMCFTRERGSVVSCGIGQLQLSRLDDRSTSWKTIILVFLGWGGVMSGTSSHCEAGALQRGAIEGGRRRMKE